MLLPVRFSDKLKETNTTDAIQKFGLRQLELKLKAPLAIAPVTRYSHGVL